MYSSNHYNWPLYKPSVHSIYERNAYPFIYHRWIPFAPSHLPYIHQMIPNDWPKQVESFQNHFLPSTSPFHQLSQDDVPTPFMLPYMNSSPFQSFLNTFKNETGSIDFNKMFHTTGQMMNVFSQIGSMIKGFGQIFK